MYTVRYWNRRTDNEGVVLSDIPNYALAERLSMCVHQEFDVSTWVSWVDWVE